MLMAVVTGTLLIAGGKGYESSANTWSSGQFTVAFNEAGGTISQSGTLPSSGSSASSTFTIDPPTGRTISHLSVTWRFVANNNQNWARETMQETITYAWSFSGIGAPTVHSTIIGHWWGEIFMGNTNHFTQRFSLRQDTASSFILSSSIIIIQVPGGGGPVGSAPSNLGATIVIHLNPGDPAISLDTHTVTFNLNGGVLGHISAPAFTHSLLHNAPTIQPANPTRAGYRFMHWSLSDPTVDPNGAAIPFGFGVGLTEDITLHAVWAEHQGGLVWFNFSGPTSAMPPRWFHQSNTASLQLPSMTYMNNDFVSANPSEFGGREFLGWWDNSGFLGIAITAVPTGVEGRFEVYARWR